MWFKPQITLGGKLIKVFGLVLFIAHMIGCNSLVLGYMVGSTADDNKIIRQLQSITR